MRGGGGGGGGAPEVIFHKLEVGEQAAVLLTRTHEAEETEEAVEEVGVGSGEVSQQLLEAAQAVVDRDTGTLGDTAEEFPA